MRFPSSTARRTVVVVSCALWGKVFKATFFVAESMYVSPQHVSFKIMHFQPFQRAQIKKFSRGACPCPPYTILVVSLRRVQSEPPPPIDLFTNMVAILNYFDLRSIMGCPGSVSTICCTCLVLEIWLSP